MQGGGDRDEGRQRRHNGRGEIDRQRGTDKARGQTGRGRDGGGSEGGGQTRRDREGEPARGSSSRSNATELGSMSGGQNPPCAFSAFCSREHEKVHTWLLSVFLGGVHVCEQTNGFGLYINGCCSMT